MSYEKAFEKDLTWKDLIKDPTKTLKVNPQPKLFENNLNFREYAAAAKTTAIYKDSIAEYVNNLGIEDDKAMEDLFNLLCLAYAVLGLAGETGELAGKLKKVIRDGQGKITDEVRTKLADETGDVQWYVGAVSDELDAPLEDVAENNLTKLNSRARRGVLGGSGDNR